MKDCKKSEFDESKIRFYSISCSNHNFDSAVVTLSPSLKLNLIRSFLKFVFLSLPDFQL